MEINVNEIPEMNIVNSITGCCPKFNPDPWEESKLTFEKKLFLRAKSKNFFHVPLNLGKIMPRAMEKIEKAEAAHKDSNDSFFMLSYDPSPWTGEHYFSITRHIPGEDVVELSGTFLTKVFEGPYKNAKNWLNEMKEYVKTRNKTAEKVYFFYTTCPKCARHFGKNYVVAVAQVE